MSKICHAHCPSSGRSGLVVFLVGLAAAAVACSWLSVRIGKPVQVFIAAGCILATSSLVAWCIRAAVRDTRAPQASLSRGLADVAEGNVRRLDWVTDVATPAPDPGAREDLPDNVIPLRPRLRAAA